MLAGQLAIRAPHLDGSEDIGVWFDAAWAVYIDVVLSLASVGADFIGDAWDEMAGADEPGAPTMENWGTSEKAQRGQASLMAMLGGGPGGGAAESSGDA